MCIYIYIYTHKDLAGVPGAWTRISVIVVIMIMNMICYAYDYDYDYYD